jgi:hypothetical protein
MGSATGGGDGKIVSCEIPLDEAAATCDLTSTDISNAVTSTNSGQADLMNVLDEHPRFGQDLEIQAEDTLRQILTITPLILQHHLPSLESNRPKVSYTLKSYAFIHEDEFLATTESGLVTRKLASCVLSDSLVHVGKPKCESIGPCHMEDATKN